MQFPRLATYPYDFNEVSETLRLRTMNPPSAAMIGNDAPSAKATPIPNQVVVRARAGAESASPTLAKVENAANVFETCSLGMRS